MSQQPPRSPQQAIKRSQLISSPTNTNSNIKTGPYTNCNSTNKLKGYLPSRYAQDRKPQKIGFQDILNSIQAVTAGDVGKNKRQNSPKLKALYQKNQLPALGLPCTLGTSLQSQIQNQQKKPKTSQFKNRPMKRQKSDQIQFNQIFLNPRQEALEQLRKKSNLEDNIKIISKQYQKLLKFQQDNTVKKYQQNPSDTTNSAKKNINYTEIIEMFESGDLFGINIKCNQNDFYDNHISIQPPDIPTVSTSQTNSPGTSYAPSIPSNYKNIKNLNVKQLLMRATAGMNGQDIEKQAHLSYFLGQVYSQKKMFCQSLKFHKRYLGFAKAMQDIVGMSLGANRVAIGYYNCGQIQRSIMFHNENLKLSNNQNCFVGFYNIGICYRKLNKLSDALQYFQSALNWSQEKGQQQSQCIAYGQIGVTYQIMQAYQKSIQNFQKSIEICNKIKKQDLKLHNLRFILRICSMLRLKSIQQIEKIVQQAFLCAQESLGLKMLDIFRCNLGIIRGMQKLIEESHINLETNQIQQIA